jgi:hypothetical protein
MIMISLRMKKTCCLLNQVRKKYQFGTFLARVYERGCRNRSAVFKWILNGFLMFLSEGKLLDESNLTLLHAYTLKVEDGVRNTTFNKFCFAFPQAPLDSIKSTVKWVQFLPGFQPICKADRYKADGTTPQAYFEYLLIIPHLWAMVANFTYAEKMQYQSNHVCNPTKITDIFDGAHYTSLLEKFVTIGNEELPMWFFSDP